MQRSDNATAQRSLRHCQGAPADEKPVHLYPHQTVHPFIMRCSLQVNKKTTNFLATLSYGNTHAHQRLHGSRYKETRWVPRVWSGEQELGQETTKG